MKYIIISVVLRRYISTADYDLKYCMFNCVQSIKWSTPQKYNVTTHLYLVPSLWMNGTIHPLPYAFMAWTGKFLLLFFHLLILPPPPPDLRAFPLTGPPLDFLYYCPVPIWWFVSILQRQSANSMISNTELPTAHGRHKGAKIKIRFNQICGKPNCCH
jgi:hypothetical protein